MIDDDQPIGHLLSRRELVTLLGAAGAAWLMPGVLNACVVRPQQTEGPFFFESPKRADIRSGQRGTALGLTLLVSRLKGTNCEPLPGAQVDLWQCDAEGNYSETNLRGYQIADNRGAARFVTLYPGWYPGRTVHVHFKIRQDDREFTSQLYFDDALTDVVHREAPYGNSRRRTRNQNDGIFRRGGEQLKLDVTRSSDVLAATFSIAMQF
ncbi:MAG TPA: hypothetical protein VG106_10240 [Vicinamibacterales bacterium]|nr:hypothetical protein [Vicinamibacterales bacterium]